MNKNQSDGIKMPTDKTNGILGLLEIMRRLRDPKSGCPWDLEQNFKTIAPHTIEEAYEVVDAIDREDWQDLKLELGDLLLQTVYHCQMASELGWFDFNDVVEAICHKMISRHPHVFGDEARPTVSKQIENWEQAKAVERDKKSTSASALEGVASSLPSLTRALKLQKRAARVGFDWTKIEDVIDKVTEEVKELSAEINAGNQSAVYEEFGDLLFSMVNFSRHANIDAESALRFASNKFHARFTEMERQMTNDGLTVVDANPDALERYWARSKQVNNQS